MDRVPLFHITNPKLFRDASLDQEQEGEDRSIEHGLEFFKDHILPHPHTHFMLEKAEGKGPAILSVGRGMDKQHFVLVRDEKGSSTQSIPQNSTPSLCACIPPSFSTILKHYDASLIDSPYLTEVEESKLDGALLDLDEKQCRTRFKFGVLWIRRSQQSENDVFAQEHPKEQNPYIEFLEDLGELVQLKGYRGVGGAGYMGGLDSKHGTTGEHALVARGPRGEFIVFHTCTLIPKTGGQQVERKMHVGNDVVCVVFVDEDAVFLPERITSKQQHVWLLVRRVEKGYQLGLVTKSVVEPFGPLLPAQCSRKELGDIVTQQLIAGEHAAMESVNFRKALWRTRARTLIEVQESFLFEDVE